MCGIAGFINHQLNEEAKKELTFKMLHSIVHRGPENSSVWVKEAVSLGHNRLKIIDLSDEANQPFEYEGVILIFNGEVYNYLEIRKELERKAYRFRTQGDTEVICAAYKEWGEQCVTRFIGMWAFALWDVEKQCLFCSRDRFGIKPFYYIQNGQNFYFASEYKALKHVPDFDSSPNISQLQRGISMAWTGYKEETFYHSIRNLEPAHNLIWQNNEIRLIRYWDIDFADDQKAEILTWEEKKAKFQSLFKESIKLHSRSDVQNGTCLSGGLDSSAISSVYSTLFPESTIKSFSVYYEGKSGVDERPYIREVIKKYPNIKPFYFTPSPAQIAENFHTAAYHADVPFIGSSYYSQYFLMQLAKSEGVTVVLNGQGADEFLGGYLHSFYRILASQIASLQFGKACTTFTSHLRRENYGMRQGLDIALKTGAALLHEEDGMYNLELQRGKKYFPSTGHVQFKTKTKNKFNNFLYHLLFNTTLPTLLHFEDRNSMAFSLESRVPFLNHKLVEFAFTLTNEERISTKAETKFILRESLKPVLPTGVYERKDKKGFVTPGEILWLNGPLKFLLDIDYNLLNFMNKDLVKQEVENYKKGDVRNAKLVWRIATTHYWMKNFM
jgi:asparagine synthase (glutamine-hydrolysing)